MNKTLLYYAGYPGSAEVSLDDNCLYGKVLCISDLVTYEAQDVPGLRKAFEAAVKNYLGQCAALGIAADPPPKNNDSSLNAGLEA